MFVVLLNDVVLKQSDLLGFFGIFSPSDFQDEPAAPSSSSNNNNAEPEMSVEEIKQAAATWVSRCQIGAFIYITLWIGWIVAAQLLRKSSILPSSWFILNPDNAELTGW